MLAELERHGRHRALVPNSGVDFSSNDFLALTRAPEMRTALQDALDEGLDIGSGGSRLLRGNHPEIEALEADACAHFSAASALYMASGYLANFAVLTTLPQRGDRIFYDALIHASSHEGMRAGRAEFEPFPHNDMTALEDQLSKWRSSNASATPWIAVESLYSMDGDRAPLDEIVTIAERYGAMVLIDEAHATGVFGPAGRGLAHALEGRPDVITLHTCGKALGASGALITLAEPLRRFLVNRCRSFIYTTAPSPLAARAVRTALKICRDNPAYRRSLHDLVVHTHTALQGTLGVPGSGSQIIPYIVGENDRTMQLASALQAAGLDVRGIRPPTVPEGTSRLRISVTLHASASDVDRLVATLAEHASAKAA